MYSKLTQAQSKKQDRRQSTERQMHKPEILALLPITTITT